jgi:hypothetical protein
MGDSTLDTLKRLIVGRRGRARADRLVVTSADGEQRPIAIKAQRNASAYVDLVDSLAPVRIEAYAGDELLATHGEPPAPKPPRGAAAKAPPATASVPPSKKKKVAPEDPMAFVSSMVERITTNFAKHIAEAYKTASEHMNVNFASLAGIAQHHSDRAGNAELAREMALKSVRVRDKAINEQNAMILKLTARLNEIASETDEDKKGAAFAQLMGFLRGENPFAPEAAGAKSTTTTNGNGAAKKAKPS